LPQKRPLLKNWFRRRKRAFIGWKNNQRRANFDKVRCIMPKFEPLKLTVRPLPDFDATNWNAIANAFANAASCELQQAWLEKPEADFASAQVRVGWRDNHLLVYAELADYDIFNDAKHLNDATYAKGDIFEIFVRPENQSDYWEFHITPENQNLQLHWPDDKAVWTCEDSQESLAPYFFQEQLIQSQTQIRREQNVWRVLARVPASVAQAGSTPDAKIEDGAVWSFSFSRYDCTRGRELPVWSASSPHPEPKFHRQQEWGRLIFAGS
jgi:hypothetical protein